MSHRVGFLSGLLAPFGRSLRPEAPPRITLIHHTTAATEASSSTGPRASPSYLAERTGASGQLISQRLRDLVMAGYVEKIHTGLYELAEDPDQDGV